MLNMLYYLFVAYALVSVYVQTADLAVKQFTSPTLAGLVAVCAIIGLATKRITTREGILFAAAWALAAASGSQITPASTRWASSKARARSPSRTAMRAARLRPIDALRYE